jgi:glycosyltransferase involved in cell wall biosynthesis
MKILVAYPNQASFIQRDIKILAEKHDVRECCIYHANPIRFVADVRRLAKSDAVLFWFSGIYALPLAVTARLLRKKVVAIVGGYEAANCPEIGYGSARKPLLRFLISRVLRLSHRILAVSQTSRNDIIRNLKIPVESVTLLYHGFEDIANATGPTKQPTLLNIGHLNESTWLLKGIFDFARIAEFMPDLQFVHIGRIDSDPAVLLGRPFPANLKFIGAIPFDSLRDYLSPAKIYLQLSRQESFSCSVAEAMMFRCIPVVSDAAALPEVVGDCGILLESREPEVVAKAVRKALEMPESEGERARRRILTHFSYAARRDALLAIFDSLGSE